MRVVPATGEQHQTMREDQSLNDTTVTREKSMIYLAQVEDSYNRQRNKRVGEYQHTFAQQENYGGVRI